MAPNQQEWLEMAPELSPGAENRAPSIQPCLEVDCNRPWGQVGPPMARFGEIGVIRPHQMSGLLRQLNRAPPDLGSAAWRSHLLLPVVQKVSELSSDDATVYVHLAPSTSSIHPLNLLLATQENHLHCIRPPWFTRVLGVLEVMFF